MRTREFSRRLSQIDYWRPTGIGYRFGGRLWFGLRVRAYEGEKPKQADGEGFHRVPLLTFGFESEFPRKVFPGRKRKSTKERA